MQKLIGDLVVDVFLPEFAKFKAPLVLVHGLWSTSSCWTGWANHFSNLGWECWAINFKGRPHSATAETVSSLTLDDCQQDLERVIRAAPEPPVLLGHGFGGLLASQVAADERVSALVLLSPPSAVGKPSKWLRLLRIKYFPLLWLRRSFLLQEKDFRQTLLASVSQNRHAEILPRMVPESGHLMWEFFMQRMELNPGNGQCCVLLIGGSEDKLVPIAALRETAKKLRADFREYLNHGHWIMGEEGGKEIVRDIHRWLIQKLGENILLADFSAKE